MAGGVYHESPGLRLPGQENEKRASLSPAVVISSVVRYVPISANFELHPDVIAFFQFLCLANTYFDGNKVKAVFGEQGSLEFCPADPYVDRDHSPAVRHHG